MEQYERIKTLGRGAFGVAVLVREKTGLPGSSPGPLRVIKDVDLGQLPPSARKEAQKEVLVLARFKHPNIVEYYTAFITPEKQSLHIVMEYADGGDLAAIVRQRREEQSQFSEGDALVIFGQCLEALVHIHSKNVLHRDIKCQNIFCMRSGTVKLGDFGIARVLEHTASAAKTMIGTPNYLAPEVCENAPYNDRADIWSLGVVFYELLTLQQPFSAYNMAALVLKIVTAEPAPLPAHYSADVQGIVHRTLQKKPTKRPGASELLNLPAVRCLVGSRFQLTDGNGRAAVKTPSVLRAGGTCHMATGSQQGCDILKIDTEPETECHSFRTAASGLHEASNPWDWHSVAAEAELERQRNKERQTQQNWHGPGDHGSPGGGSPARLHSGCRGSRSSSASSLGVAGSVLARSRPEPLGGAASPGHSTGRSEPSSRPSSMAFDRSAPSSRPSSGRHLRPTTGAGAEVAYSTSPCSLAPRPQSSSGAADVRWGQGQAGGWRTRQSATATTRLCESVTSRMPRGGSRPRQVPSRVAVEEAPVSRRPSAAGSGHGAHEPPAPAVLAERFAWASRFANVPLDMQLPAYADSQAEHERRGKLDVLFSQLNNMTNAREDEEERTVIPDGHGVLEPGGFSAGDVTEDWGGAEMFGESRMCTGNVTAFPAAFPSGTVSRRDILAAALRT